jgi:nucleotide-binding universal stress UspA family protein
MLLKGGRSAVKVLLPLDDSPGSVRTLQWATTALDPEYSQVHLVHVIADPDAQAVAQSLVESASRLLAFHSFKTVQTAVLYGHSIVDTLCRYVKEADIEQIILSAHGHPPWRRVLLGSVSHQLLQQSPVPVLVLKSGESPSMILSHAEEGGLCEHTPQSLKVLLPVDGSSAAERTLDWAAHFLNSKWVRLYLLHIVAYTPSFPEGLAWFEESKALLRAAKAQMEAAGFEVEEIYSVMAHPSEPVARRICDFAQKRAVDQIILGTQGRGVSRMLLGSVSRTVFEHAEQPVWLLKNDSLDTVLLSRQGPWRLAPCEETEDRG